MTTSTCKRRNALLLISTLTILLAACASTPQRMTGAALQGNLAELDDMLRSGPTQINTAVMLGSNQPACPGVHFLTPLQAAACAGQTAAVQKLLANKADPNLAVGAGKSPLSLALDHGREAVIRPLVEAGAIPDATDAQGNTALMLASRRGDLSLATFLLSKGASPHRINAKGEDALMMAADAAIAKALIGHGARPFQRNPAGESARQAAERSGRSETATFLKGVEERAHHEVEKQLAVADKAAKEQRFRDALVSYATAISQAADLDGSTEKDIRVRVVTSVNAWPDPPGLSAKAREHVVRSSYILKNSQEFGQAEQEIAKALNVDPWWLEGYYNLGLMQAKTNKFDEAERNLSVFIAAAPLSPKTQAAQDKIYELRLAKEEADKISGVQGRWVDAAGAAYTVTINGNRLRITSLAGQVFSLSIVNNILKGSVEAPARPGPHRCTLPGQMHPVNGRLDADARGISLEYLWSTYDTRFHYVNMFGAPVTGNCLTCDEVCDAVNIVATNTVRLRLVPAGSHIADKHQLRNRSLRVPTR